jgi:hypothetical protein
MSHTAIVPDHSTPRNYLLQHRLPLYCSKPVMAHIETYMVAATAKGFRGKVVNLSKTLTYVMMNTIDMFATTTQAQWSTETSISNTCNAKEPGGIEN